MQKNTLGWIILACGPLLGLLAAVGMHAKPEPVYEWKSLRSDAFTLQPSGLWYLGPFPKETITGIPLRIETQATTPITFGFMPRNWLEAVSKDPALLAVPENSNKLRCGSADSLGTSRECSIPNANEDQYFVVFDSRKPPTTGDAFVAGAMAYFGAKDRLQTMAAENRVSIALSVNVCTQNCEGR